MKKSLLYRMFTHGILRGKHKLEMKKFKVFYPIEKELLRTIAALKNMYSDDLTEDILKSSLEAMELKNLTPKDFSDYENCVRTLLDPLLTSYFYLGNSYDIKNRKIDFIHESFKEYFLAEHYFESIRDGKMLSGLKPDETTMNSVLKSIVEMLEHLRKSFNYEEFQKEFPKWWLHYNQFLL